MANTMFTQSRLETQMAKCEKCETTEGLVYSGVDALVLGVLDQIEKICYNCANKTITESK